MHAINQCLVQFCTCLQDGIPEDKLKEDMTKHLVSKVRSNFYSILLIQAYLLYYFFVIADKCGSVQPSS